jgi:UDP-N-acetylmuramoylalanine--D-glutamate ligase
VVGLGRSGVAAARLLLANGVAVYGSDAGAGQPLDAVAAELTVLGAAVDLGGHDLDRIRNAAAVVLSPGVPPDAPPVRAARDAGVPVRAEIDVGLEALAGVPYIGITGTNGKTTVTALTAHLLRAAGRDAEAGGNIGTPLCEIALRDRRPAWLAIEFSSFQLHDCPGVRPAVGILTNLSADHLDRYPSIEAYYADKRLLFANADAGSIWVSNGDDADSQALTSGVAGRHLHFSTRYQTDGWYDRGGDRLMLGSEDLVGRQELPLLGDHNVANALAAGLAVAATDVSPAAIRQGLRSFRALSHRLEPVREAEGVLWINDSKATNVASTEVAVAALERPFVLLLGGRHKGEPYGRLAPGLRRLCRAVVAYGEAAPLVAADLAGVVPVERGGSFEDVLERAARLARPGDAVLLSPACSSYDMFRNYEERGTRFREWVEAR